MVSVDITKNFIWSTPHFKTKQDEGKKFNEKSQTLL
jgi:hypothetical protein